MTNTAFDLNKLTIFVEGAAAKNFFESFTKQTYKELANKCDFRAFQANKDGMFSNLDTALRAWFEQIQKLSPLEDLPKLAIITDADTSAVDAETKTNSAIQRAKDLFPENLQSICKILITPCYGTNALEAVLLKSINSDFIDVKNCAEAFAQCVAKYNPKTEPFAKQNWTDKVVVHAMLAACENPEIPLWDKKGFKYWNADADELKRIADEIKALCN